MSTMTQWKPFPIFDSNWDVAFDDLVRKTFATMEASAWMPAADVTRDGDDLLIVLEVPGLQAGDLEMEVRDQVLTVRGHRLVENGGGQNIRNEIRRGDFSRTFRLPRTVVPEDVRASYSDGFLTVRVPGATPQPRVSRIPIEGLQQNKGIESPAIQAEIEASDGDMAKAS